MIQDEDVIIKKLFVIYNHKLGQRKSFKKTQKKGLNGSFVMFVMLFPCIKYY